MANSINNCTFTGNLGQDPQFSMSTKGNSICNLNLAVSNYDFAAKAETTLWVRVTLFGQKAEFAEKYAVKGDKVGVTGRLQVRKYNDKEGVERTSIELVAQDFEILHSPSSDHSSAGSRRADDDYDPFLDDDLPGGAHGEKEKAVERPARSRTAASSRR